MALREPGWDDNEENLPPTDEDEEELVPLGEVLSALDAQRAAAKQAAIAETTEDLLKRQSRTPPHAMDAERAVLGGILIEPTSLQDALDEELSPGDFYRPHHGTIFGVILALHDKGEPIDALTVVEEILRIGQLDRVGGAAAISQLEALLPTAAHVGAYAKLVREKAVRRAVLAAATRLVEAAHEPAEKTDALLERAQRAFTDLAVKGRADPFDRRTLVREIMDQIGKPGAKGLPTGFRDLDAGLWQRGMHAGELIIVGARPAMGKTAMGHQMAVNVADLGVPVAFFSLEMTPKQLLTREIAGQSRLGTSVWARELRGGNLQHAAGHVAERPLHIEHAAGWGIGKISARLRRMVAQMGVGFAVVDYLGLIGGTGDYRGNRVQEVGQVSRALKQLAGECMIPLLVLSQLNRGVESRATKRPGLADLRDTGDIEQDADVVAMIHRPEYYKKEETPDHERNVAEIIIEKQRNGPTGVCELFFSGETTRFGDLAHDRF